MNMREAFHDISIEQKLGVSRRSNSQATMCSLVRLMGVIVLVYFWGCKYASFSYATATVHGDGEILFCLVASHRIMHYFG